MGGLLSGGSSSSGVKKSCPYGIALFSWHGVQLFQRGTHSLHAERFRSSNGRCFCFGGNLKTVYVLFRDGENYGERSAVGWYESNQAAADAALKMEWEHYRAEVVVQQPGVKVLSPDETDYRHFNVEAIHKID
ncbi:hypothetical protein [Pseudomonas viridiflava]|uniref:hypothetical protein n=1 Tax=Pseudomonas viridiflava TaxID=33069 RepID=UPI001F141EEB|nr:hypothetical protein [Pseudomonas viridiflava]